ncbi:MAG: hypothetical protein K2Y20_05165 [Sphingomonas sp.]|nr:hypothetical protein [Sphingomonas sp.]
MKLAREGSGDGPLIQGFARGGFRVDDNIYTALLITPQRADGWTPPPVEALDEAALAPLLALDPPPEFILLGTGTGLILPPRALVAGLEARGIGVEPMDSRAAARAWSVLRGEGRWIAGALYPL